MEGFSLIVCDCVLLGGEFGEGVVMVMCILMMMVGVFGVSELFDIEGVYIDGCFYYGELGFDFVECFVDGGVKVEVLMMLNVGVIDLLYFEFY